MELKFEAPRKNELLALYKDNVNAKDISITVRKEYLRHPVPFFEITEGFDLKKFMRERDVKIAKAIANDIIIPDPAPKKILDTTRLLAEKTNNLLLELWNYIGNGKIIQSAVLLMTAQKQIRRGSSSRINGSSKKNGFDIINKCIMRLSFSLRWEKGSHGMSQELLQERKTLIDCAWLLVDVISHAGEDLSAYTEAHSEVSHVEVFQHVSSILKEYGFCPTGDSMATINLRPYACKKSDGESCKVKETANLDAAEEKAVRKKQKHPGGGGWDPTYTKRSFFPYWRSMLQARSPMRVYPAYANAGCLLKLGSVRRISQLTSKNQPRRCFITAATGAFRLLKGAKVE